MSNDPTCFQCGDVHEVPIGPPFHADDCDCSWDSFACAQRHIPCPACNAKPDWRALADRLAQALRKADRELRMSLGIKEVSSSCQCDTCTALADYEQARGVPS